MIPIIIQARYSSQRLPGKVLMPWGENETLLGHVIEECKRTGLEVWVATSDQPDDVAVAYEALAHGARVYVGSLDDVLGRFVACVDAMDEEPEAIVRICADRPFLSAALITAAVGIFRENQREIMSIGSGSLTVEVIRTDYLRRWEAEMTDARAREHVTAGMLHLGFPDTIDSASDYARLAPA